MADYYGQSDGSSEIKTVQERCREYYGISDFVVVKNIDDRPFVYQVQRVENQSFDQPDSVSMVIQDVKPPERISLQPDETRLVPAYEADLMMKALIDKMVYRNRQLDFEAAEDDNGEPTFRESVMDPSTQHKYIKAIYQGKRDFLAEYNESLAPPTDAVLKDLETGYESKLALERGKADAAKKEAEKLRAQLAKVQEDKKVVENGAKENAPVN